MMEILICAVIAIVIGLVLGMYKDEFYDTKESAQDE